MGTRSFVGVMKGDVCRAIYVHWDGYLDGVGAELQDYTTQEAVEELIAPGDRSSLTENFYKDRGESDVDPADYKSFEEFYDECEGAGCEYYYIFKDGVWYCGNTYSSSTLRKKLTAYADACEIEAAEREAVDG